MMAKFRKKPVEIEAFRWTGGPDQTEAPKWACDAIRADVVRFSKPGAEGVMMLIKTPEGSILRARAGDWITRGMDGEIGMCRADTFDATYESVEPGADDGEHFNGR